MTSALDDSKSRRSRLPSSRRQTDATGRPVGVGPGTSVLRRRQLPWVALGVLLLVMSMLGFALWSVQQAARTPVLVVGTAINAGDRIERADLILVSVGADAGLELLRSGQEDLVVGRVARGPIPVGTPLSPALVVSPSEAVPVGQAVVGTALKPGEYPTSALRAGDRVRLIKTTTTLNSDDAGVVELGEASVWTVEPLLAAAQQQLFVSLLVPELDAAQVANVAAEGRLRLILIGAES